MICIQSDSGKIQDRELTTSFTGVLWVSSCQTVAMAKSFVSAYNNRERRRPQSFFFLRVTGLISLISLFNFYTKLLLAFFTPVLNYPQPEFATFWSCFTLSLSLYIRQSRTVVTRGQFVVAVCWTDFLCSRSYSSCDAQSYSTSHYIFKAFKSTSTARRVRCTTLTLSLPTTLSIRVRQESPA